MFQCRIEKSLNMHIVLKKLLESVYIYSGRRVYPQLKTTMRWHGRFFLADKNSNKRKNKLAEEENVLHSIHVCEFKY